MEPQGLQPVGFGICLHQSMVLRCPPLHAGLASSSHQLCLPPASPSHTLDLLAQQVVGEEDRQLQKRLKYLGERMHRRGAQEEGERAGAAGCQAVCLHSF